MWKYSLEKMVLGDVLQERATTHRNSPFLKFRIGELTYGEVAEMANRVAAGLAANGIRQRDHVAVMLPNRPELLYVTFALARLGAVAVPINTEYKGECYITSSRARTLRC